MADAPKTLAELAERAGIHVDDFHEFKEEDFDELTTELEVKPVTARVKLRSQFRQLIAKPQAVSDQTKFDQPDDTLIQEGAPAEEPTLHEAPVDPAALAPAAACELGFNPEAPDEGSPLRLIQEQTTPSRSSSEKNVHLQRQVSAGGSPESPRRSPRTPRGITLDAASKRVAEELSLEHVRGHKNIASEAREKMRLPRKRADILLKDDFAEICLQLGIDTGWEGQDSGTAIETWKGIINSDDVKHRRAALQEVVDARAPGRWTIEKELGRGGNGRVYVATDSHMKPLRVALKFCAGQQDKLRREAGLLQRVRHENICGLYVDFPSKDGGMHVMCLEFLDGGTFEEVMKAAPKNRVREFEVTRMAFDVLQALSVMHSQDVIHRDIKPSNIMLKTTVDGPSAFKIIDLGISVMEHGSDVSDTLLTSTTGLAEAIGTPHYMSPEQFTAGMVVDQRTDIWSLGVAMYHALTGVLPFAPSEQENTKIQHSITSTTPIRVESVLDEVGAISEGISDLIIDMLQKDPLKRPQLATDVMQSLVDAFANNADEQIFDVFINYRVWCQQTFAETLFKKLSATRLGHKRVMVYLDKVRLLDGKKFDEGFVKGLASSKVFAPLLSADCMKGFMDIDAADKEDFVLMEWIMAIELQRHDIVSCIFPIIIGDQKPDGRYDEGFFEELRSGTVNGRPIPNIVSAKTTQKARDFLRKLPSGPIELSQELTVKEVVDELLRYQAILLHTHSQLPDGGIEASTVRTHGDSTPQHGTPDYVITYCAERITKVVAELRVAEPQPEPAVVAAKTEIHQPQPEPAEGTVVDTSRWKSHSEEIRFEGLINGSEGKEVTVKARKDVSLRIDLRATQLARWKLFIAKRDIAVSVHFYPCTLDGGATTRTSTSRTSTEDRQIVRQQSVGDFSTEGEQIVKQQIVGDLKKKRSEGTYGDWYLARCDGQLVVTLHNSYSTITEKVVRYVLEHVDFCEGVPEPELESDLSLVLHVRSDDEELLPVGVVRECSLVYSRAEPLSAEQLRAALRDELQLQHDIAVLILDDDFDEYVRMQDDAQIELTGEASVKIKKC